MEVLFITHKYPPSIGGMEKQSYELIKGVSKNFKVHSIVYDNNSSKVKFLLTLKKKVQKILDENPGISVIHLNDGLMAIFAYKLKKITNIPIIATLHGLDIVFPSIIFQKIAVNRFKKLDGIIAVSNATAEECHKRGFDKDKVFVVKNGVDTELGYIKKISRFRTTMEERLGISLENKKILISVGRSVRRKGFSWFINRVLPKLDENVIYLIVGPPQQHLKKIQMFFKLIPNHLAHLISLLFGWGMDEIDIRRALEDPAVKGRGFYLGKLPFEEMIQFLKHADIFVMPNIKVYGDAEGFGLVALEAAVNNTTVVASAIEGITCAIQDGKNGFLVPAENVTAWTEKINALLSEDSLLDTFSRASRDFTMENYSWDHMVDGYVTVFNRYHKAGLNEQEAPVFNFQARDYSKVAV